MTRLKLLAAPALAALLFPLTADAGLLRNRNVVISGPITPPAPTTATAAAQPPAATKQPAPTPSAAGGRTLPAPTTAAAPATGAAPAAATGGCASGNCGGGRGGLGGFFERLCGGGGGGGGGFGGHDGHGGGLANHPPVDNGPLFRGFGFCQPPFQAAPWYLYWPYDSHFQLPAPIGAPYYPPQQFGSQWSPYFANPGMAPGFGPMPGR